MGLWWLNLELGIVSLGRVLSGAKLEKDRAAFYCFGRVQRTTAPLGFTQSEVSTAATHTHHHHPLDCLLLTCPRCPAAEVSAADPKYCFVLFFSFLSFPFLFLLFLVTCLQTAVCEGMDTCSR